MSCGGTTADRGRLWLILDRHGSHNSAPTARAAAGLRIKLLFLPRQCPELNPMDHLWRGAKAEVSSNRQYNDIDEQTDEAERWILILSPRDPKRKAGMLSKNSWLFTYEPLKK